MATAEKASYPKTLWLSTPEQSPRILIPDPKTGAVTHKLRFHEGYVNVTNAHEEATVRRATGNRVYEQDLTEPKIDKGNGWACWSSEAWIAYIENRPPHQDPLHR